MTFINLKQASFSPGQVEELVSEVVRLQMSTAIKYLRDWNEHDAVIAGGALWSWAAGNLARDVDIFVQWSEEAELQANAVFGSPVGDKSETYAKDFIKYRPAELVTKIDFLLVQRVRGEGSQLAPNFFDYAHCEVAFGLSWQCRTGAEAYRTGTVRAVKPLDTCRDVNYVLGKVERKLWGCTAAPAALDRVLVTLDTMARQENVF